jgi:membrane protease YdiL (CAAX protease family)
MTALQPLLDAFRGPQRKPTLILLSTPVLLLVWKYFCTPEGLVAPAGPGWSERTASGPAVCFLGCFVLLGLIPALMVKLVFRERLSDYGIAPGIPGRTWAALGLLVPVFVLLAYLSARDPAIRVKFPIDRQACISAALFAQHAALYLLYYLGWEFFFRGFLLHGLRGSVGDANAVLIQALASALLHIGGPAAETFGSILGGLLWGVLALYTRSLLSGLIQHALLGLALDAFICFG